MRWLWLLLLPSVLSAQSVRITEQTVRDSLTGASATFSFPTTAKRFRIRWQACIQLNAVSNSWRCNQETGPWNDVTPPVTLPPVVTVTAVPDLLPAGSQSQLTWNATNGATECFGTFAGQTYPLAPSGSVSAAITASGVILVRCTGPGGTGQDSVRVTVTTTPPPSPPPAPPPPPPSPPPAPPPPPPPPAPPPSPPPAPPPPPTGGATPNMPAGWRTREVLDFSQAIPQTQHGAIANGWELSFSNPAQQSATRVSDPTAPVSPSSVFQSRFYAGMNTGGGVGNVGKTFSPALQRVYVALWVKHDASFQFHPISNKLFYMEPGNLILTSRIWDFGELPSQRPSYLTLQVNQQQEFRPPASYQLPLGVWVRIEILADVPARTYKVWADGVQVLNATGVNMPSGGFNELKLDTTWGGSGGSKVGDSYRWTDHLIVATP